ncbi:hypothetical protein L1887_54107 [Cichorium endivia]|nr:hypothetical protein L1887_54107 [Cichorium endivia]
MAWARTRQYVAIQCEMRLGGGTYLCLWFRHGCCGGDGERWWKEMKVELSFPTGSEFGPNPSAPLHFVFGRLRSSSCLVASLRLHPGDPKQRKVLERALRSSLFAMIPTPSLAHLTKSDLRRVYEPAEDSFALLDALEADADVLRSSLGTYWPLILGPTAAAYVAVDVNDRANRCTVATGKHNGVHIEAARASLLSALQPRAGGKIDVLLFNPPYVPTEEEEEQMAQHDKDIAGAWAGGATGTKLVDALIG